MKTTRKWFLLLLAGFSPTAFAGIPASGGQLIYGSNPSAIPTLGGATLVILGLLLAVVAFRAIKTNSHQLMSIGLVVLAITASYSGVKLVSEAKAGHVSPTILLDNPAGGSVRFLELDYNIFHNTTNVILQIQSVTFDQQGACSAYPTGIKFREGPECVAGIGLASEDSCVISCLTE